MDVRVRRARLGTNVGPVGAHPGDRGEDALLERWLAQFWMTRSTIHESAPGHTSNHLGAVPARAAWIAAVISDCIGLYRIAARPRPDP